MELRGIIAFFCNIVMKLLITIIRFITLLVYYIYMKQRIVTADDVAEATEQSVESVAQSWHNIGDDQRQVKAASSEDSESSTDSHRMFSDD